MDLFDQDIIRKAKKVFKELDVLEEQTKIDVINEIRMELHKHSPFKT